MNRLQYLMHLTNSKVLYVYIDDHDTNNIRA